MLIRCLAWLCSLAALAYGENNYFIQAADPQFGMYAKDKNFVQETANFEFFVANVNRLKPMFAIVCGDLTSIPGDPAQVAEFERIAAKIDPAIPFHKVAGNHDVGNEPTPESLALYRKNYGPDWYSFQAPGVYGIVLNSSLLKFPDKVQADAAKQEEWLHSELKTARASAKTVVVFQHIPWFLTLPDEPDQYFNIFGPIRAKYLKLFAESSVKYVFAGHYHRNALGSGPGGLTMFTTGPIGLPLGPEPSGFRIVTVNGSELAQEYLGFGQIPYRYPVQKDDVPGPPPPTLR